jgi:murein tripeptide amidase MpaA
MPTYRVTVTGKDYDAMADLVRKHGVRLASHDAKKLPDGGYWVDVHVDDAQMRALETAGYKIQRREDAEELGRQRQAEHRAAVERTGRARVAPFAAVGRYLTVDEVESAISAAAAANAPFTQLIKLPNQTWEGRTCQAIKIGAGAGGATRPGIYFLGGVHAREWGSPDILINFVEQLTGAFRTNAGITLGQRNFTAAEIQGIVNGKDIYVFPQANPDGRHFSMTQAPGWRKNRRPAAAGQHRPSCVGVDINRNYDFLWDFKKHFDPNAPVRNSTNPCDHDVYIGPSPVSEPETRNAISMFDSFPSIRYFIDIHSHGEDILYNWGDDNDQTTNPTMNFQNPAFDGKRGIANDSAYREFIGGSDKAFAIQLATRMQAGIESVRRRKYNVEQSLTLYPTAGTSDDYAFSRHILDPTKSKVYSYTIEWGSPNNPTPFHPAYSEMSQIIKEVTAGLLEFCLGAT